MTTQDVDPKTYYAVGNGLYEKAGKLYDAFSVNVKILGETGSMAGTDDAGTAWAASYDTRVGEVLGAVNDLTAAMQNYGGVIIQAGYNHAVAEHAATPGQQGPAPVKPTEPPSVAGCLAAPPSAGGPGRGLLDDAIGVVEQLGVPVPDGDTDKIAKAADAWNRLATVYQTKSIVEALDVDARAFADTRSPEVGQIVDDLHALRDAASSVLGGCAELAKSCRAYESALDDLRNQLDGILRDLAIELAVTAAITIAASFVSFGAGAIAGTAKAAQSIKKFAGIITEAIGSWKITRSISKGVDSIEDIVGVRSKLQRLKSLGRKGKPEEPPLGTGVQRVPETPLTTSRAQIEKKFDNTLKTSGLPSRAARRGSISWNRPSGRRSMTPPPSTSTEPIEEMPRSSITTQILGSPSFRGHRENLSVDGASHQTKLQTFCGEVLFDEYESTSASGHLVLHPDHRPIHRAHHVSRGIRERLSSSGQRGASNHR